MHAVQVSHPITPSLLTRRLNPLLKLTFFPGAMTWALFDKLDGKWKQFVGVDISPKSVELYNQKAATQFTPEEMHAVCTELSGQPGELGGTTFDVIIVRPPSSSQLQISNFHIVLSLCSTLPKSARKPTTTLRT